MFTPARIAFLATALTAVPAAAVVLPAGPYHASYSIEVGGAGSVNGNGLGFHQETLGRSYGDSKVSIAPAPAVSLHGYSAGQFQSVFVDAALTYDYRVSFTALSSRYAGTYLQPVNVAGFTVVNAHGAAQVYVTIGNQYISCQQDPFTDRCGASQFVFTLDGDSVSASNLGGGLSRYTVSGNLQLSAHVTAFGDVGQINTGRAFIDPLITLDSAFAADIGATDTDVQLSTGVANASNAPATGVPEPASWALLIAGFGLTGAAARRQRGYKFGR